MQHQSVSASDKAIITNLLSQEYQILNADAARSVSATVAVLSLTAAIVGATISIAFSKWENALVVAIAFNVIVPLTVLIALVLSYVLLFWRSRTYDYIHNINENKVNQLLGPSLEIWLSEVDKSVREKGQQIHNTNPLFSDSSEFRRCKLWGWHNWTRSEQFQISYASVIKSYRVLLSCIVLFALIIPVAIGYLRISLELGWVQWGMSPLVHPVRISTLIIPILFVIPMLFVYIGLVTLNKIKLLFT